MERLFFFWSFFFIVAYSANGQTLKDLERQANRGDAFSQFTLGENYCLGKNGAEKNEKKSLKWLRQSLKNGLGEQYKGKAYRYIAFCYGRQREYKESLEWLRKGVECQDAEAQLELGWFYENGFAVAKNMDQAVYWYRKAAEQGHAQAQHNLGICYLYGKGIGKDYYQAIYWYRQAAKQGHAGAENSMGYCYYNGFGVEKDLSLAKYWWKLADEQGESHARGNLSLVADIRMPDSIQVIEGNRDESMVQALHQQKIGVPQQEHPSDVDIAIPYTGTSNQSTFAIIIGNEKYIQVADVPYANNDAKIFAEYCKKSLGLPENNVRQYDNATFGTMLSAMNDIKAISEAFKGNCNIIFYYAGHGIPNEKNRDAYLLPVDADGLQTEVCYPVSRLYKELSEMGARNVVVFMDACFSGAQRGEGMLASARGVAIKPKANEPLGNMVVFSAASEDETAYPYNGKKHGMFTYFLLKKLRETKGDCTLAELGQYIQENVRQQSVVINRKSQTPTVIPSPALMNSWKTMKLK